MHGQRGRPVSGSKGIVKTRSSTTVEGDFAVAVVEVEQLLTRAERVALLSRRVVPLLIACHRTPPAQSPLPGLTVQGLWDDRGWIVWGKSTASTLIVPLRHREILLAGHPGDRQEEIVRRSHLALVHAARGDGRRENDCDHRENAGWGAPSTVASPAHRAGASTERSHWACLATNDGCRPASARSSRDLVEPPPHTPYCPRSLRGDSSFGNRSSAEHVDGWMPAPGEGPRRASQFPQTARRAPAPHGRTNSRAQQPH